MRICLAFSLLLFRETYPFLTKTTVAFYTWVRWSLQEKYSRENKRCISPNNVRRRKIHLVILFLSTYTRCVAMHQHDVNRVHSPRYERVFGRWIDRRQANDCRFSLFFFSFALFLSRLIFRSSPAIFRQFDKRCQLFFSSPALCGAQSFSFTGHSCALRTKFFRARSRRLGNQTYSYIKCAFRANSIEDISKNLCSRSKYRDHRLLRGSQIFHYTSFPCAPPLHFLSPTMTYFQCYASSRIFHFVTLARANMTVFLANV